VSGTARVSRRRPWLRLGRITESCRGCIPRDAVKVASDPKRTVGLIESLSASGLESGSPDTAITFQALLVERQMARALSIFVMHR
jgi:hypothetical protein